MRSSLKGLGHASQEIEVEFDLKWQEVECTEWQFKEIQFNGILGNVFFTLVHKSVPLYGL